MWQSRLNAVSMCTLNLDNTPKFLSCGWQWRWLTVKMFYQQITVKENVAGSDLRTAMRNTLFSTCLTAGFVIHQLCRIKESAIDTEVATEFAL